MPPRGRNVIRIEYDRTGQNDELLPYWPEIQDRPYYELERRYSENQGKGLYITELGIMRDTMNIMLTLKELHDAATLFGDNSRSKGAIYSVEIMKRIHEIRNYDFDVRVGVWTGDFPAMFRAHHPIRISNQRHMLVDIDTIDKDPLIDDMAVISGYGTGLGVDFQGQYGVVTTRSRFSQYFRPETDSNGKPVPIVRKYVGNAPELGKFDYFDYFELFL